MISKKNLFLIGVMKSSLSTLLTLILFASCQETPKVPDYLSRRNMTPDQYKAKIKSEKKRQSELDLPYRALSGDKKIETLSFATGGDAPNSDALWTRLNKKNPDLNVMLLKASSPAKSPEYRSLREKTPFMTMWASQENVPADFLKNWPYIQFQIRDRQSLYHSFRFGGKKDSVRVIMLDEKSQGDTQWRWIDSELRQKDDIIVLVSTKAQLENSRGKLFSMIKHAKPKRIFLLTSKEEDSSITRSEIAGYGSLFEINCRYVQASPVVTAVGDAPPKLTKTTDFALLKFDWQNRQASMDIQNLDEVSVQKMQISF